MYVITAHQRHRQTDRQTDVKRSHDRYIAKACSGKNAKKRKNVTKIKKRKKNFLHLLFSLWRTTAARSCENSTSASQVWSKGRGCTECRGTQDE